MKFTEFESIMFSQGVNTLAEIARALETTPQAVSNWKARNQVPYHIADKINKKVEHKSEGLFKEKEISFSDILLVISEQIKIILIICFISVFLFGTYVQFILKPEYISRGKILISDGNSGNLGGFSGLASQFGVSVPIVGQTDLSSPSMIPEILQSRTFGEKLLRKSFFTEKFGEEKELITILTNNENIHSENRYRMETVALSILNNIIEFEKERGSSVSSIIIKTFEPLFAKNLAIVVLDELESLSLQFKSQSVSQKTNFIEKRIKSVMDDLRLSERNLKEFNEQNRQVSAPALELALDRLTRDIDVQKGIYITLKQQLELAKIEEVQEASVFQILDYPQEPLSYSNKNLRLSVFGSLVVGLLIGLIVAFLRSYLNNSDISERRKLRRVRNFLKKKGKDLIFDYRIFAIINIQLLIALPFYIGHKSNNPVYFGMYSEKLLIINIIYILVLITMIFMMIHLLRKRKHIDSNYKI